MSRPNNLTLLIDTYDTLSGGSQGRCLAPRLAAAGITIRSVRIDSGDLSALSKGVRAILDQGGLSTSVSSRAAASTKTTSRDLIARRCADRRVSGSAPPDHVADVPALDCAYKLQEYAGMRAPQALRRQGDLARTQASLAPLWTGWSHEQGCSVTRCRQAGRRAVARAGHAGRQARCADAVAG